MGAPLPQTVSTADLGPLVWVQDEVRKSLEVAIMAVKRYVREAERSRGLDLAGLDSSPLRIARQQVHQAVGALEMVGQDVPARLLGAMERLAQRLLDQAQACSEAAATAFEQAGFALIDYLDGLLKGRQASSVGLFVPYQAVLTLLGEERIHPADLWDLPWQWRTIALPPGVTPQDLASARTKLDGWVLQVVKSGQVTAAQALHDTCLGFAAAPSTPHCATFWTLAAAYFQALAQTLLQEDLVIKRTASRVLLHYRNQLKGDTTCPDSLARDLLFVCALAQKTTPDRAPTLHAVLQTYALADALPLDYVRARLGRVDPAHVQQARKRIAAASENWSALCGGDGSRVKLTGELFAQVCDAMRKLHPRSSSLADELTHAIDEALRSGRPPTGTVALEVATTVLYLESLYEDLDPDDAQEAGRAQVLAQRLVRARQGGVPEPLDAWMEDLYRRVSDRQSMGSVVQELRSAQEEVEAQLDAYFRNDSQTTPLHELPGQLAQMRGVFSVLGLDHAAQAVAAMRASVEDLLIGAVSNERRPALYNQLGNSLGALRFLIDMLSYQRELAKSLFVFDEASGELRSMIDRAPPDPAATHSPAPLADESPTLAPAQPLAAKSADAAVDTPVATPASPQAAPTTPPASAVAASTASPTTPTTAAPAGIEDTEDDAELLEIFLDEAREVIASARDTLAGLQQNPADAMQLTSLRRNFHTLKGSSRMVGLGTFGEAAWALEQVFNAWLPTQQPANAALLQLAKQALDGFDRWVSAIASGSATAWRAEPFREAADALRLHQRAMAIALPADETQQNTPQAQVDTVQKAPDFAATMTLDAALAQTQAAVAALPDLDLDFALDTPAPVDAPVSALRAPTAQPNPAETALVAPAPAVDLIAPEAPAPEAPAPSVPATDDSAVGLPDLGDLDFAATTMLDVEDGPTPTQATQPAAADLTGLTTDFLWELPAEFAQTEAPKQPEPQAEPAQAAIDFGLDGEPETAPPEAPTSTVAAPDSPPEADAGVRRIGNLRVPVALYNVFLNEADEWSRRLAVELTDWHHDLTAPITDTQVALAHSLAGSSATVGHMGLSSLARALENALVHVQHGVARDATLESLLPDAAEQLRQLLHQFAAGFLRDPSPALLDDLHTVVSRALTEPGTRSAWDTDALDDASSTQVGFAATALLDTDVPAEPATPAAPAPVVLADWPIEAAPEADTAATSLDLDADSVALPSQWAESVSPPEAEPEPATAPMPSAMPEPPPAAVLAPEPDQATVPEAVLAPDLLSAPAPIAAPEPDLAFEPETWLATASTAEPTPRGDADGAVPPATSTALAPDPTLVDAPDIDLFAIFDEEAAELVPRLGAALRRWADQPDQAGARADVLRVLHTLKGSARLAGLMQLGDRAHRLESAVEALHAPSDAAALHPLLHAYDQLVAQLEAVRTQPEQALIHPEAPAPSAPEAPVPLAPADTAAPSVGPAAEPTPTSAVAEPLAPRRGAAAAGTVRVKTQLLDQMVNQAGEVMTARTRLEARATQLRSGLDDLSGNLERLRAQLRELEVQAESQMQSRQAHTRETAAGFDPLEFDRYTRVQELTRMMAESVHDVATLQRSLQQALAGVEDELSAQARQTRELQRGLLRTRMVAFDAIAERLHGVMRQASKDTGRDVALTVVGGALEIDRGVLERMTPSFEHLLRNAVAHGIEPTAARLAAGKAAQGQVQLTLTQQSSDVQVTIRDDGAGLDLVRIQARAQAQGLIAPDAAPSPQELAQLIFHSGLSTADAVTELAGRGVGLDVVRNEVNALGGRVQVDSQSGLGTQFTLVLPLTTAVSNVVLLRLGEQVVAMPATAVELVRRVDAATLAQAQASGQFDYAGAALDFYWLGALLQASPRSAEPAGKTTAVVIARSAGQLVAVQVDEVLGNQEVVVKNLGPQLARLPGLAGMSVLASGAVVLIYNPVALAATYGARCRTWCAQQADVATPMRVQAAPTEPLVLVVDDSITVRRVTQRLLKREGFRVALAADGLQALERLQEERPAVVLSDIEMPRMDGFDLVRNIRADANLADLPVIMITSRIAQKHRDYAAALKVDHYLGKPYPEEELLRLVRDYCARSALTTA